MTLLKFVITILPANRCKVQEFASLGAAALNLQNVLFQWFSNIVGEVEDLNGCTLSLRPTHLEVDGFVCVKVQLLDQSQKLVRSAEWTINVPCKEDEDRSFYVVGKGILPPHDIANMIINSASVLMAA